MADTGTIDVFAPSRDRVTARGAAWPTVGVFLLCWAGLCATVTASLAAGFPLWLACLINAALLYVLAHINHEAIHRNISGGNPRLRWLNELIGQFGSIWYFLPFPAFKAVHLAHHAAPNDPATDGDMWVARKHPLAVAASCMTILGGYEVQLWRMAREGKLTRANLISIYGQRLVAIAAVIAAVVLGYGAEVFLLWVLPALIVMPFLAIFFAYVVHRPHDETDPYRSSNVILAPSWLQPFVTALFVFQNYHLVHHLNPRIPFYQYGEHFRARRAELEAKNAAITTL
jgi:beta-carotene hydroxylase